MGRAGAALPSFLRSTKVAKVFRALESGFDGVVMRHKGEEFPAPHDEWEAPWAVALESEIKTEETKKTDKKK